MKANWIVLKGFISFEFFFYDACTSGEIFIRIFLFLNNEKKGKPKSQLKSRPNEAHADADANAAGGHEIHNACL